MLKKCVAAVVPLLLASSLFADSVPKANDEYGDFYKGDKLEAKDWVQSIRVSEPAYRSTVKGEVTVKFTAPGMSSVRVLCWQQPTSTDASPSGHDAVVADSVELNKQGGGTFTFKADEFPHGPITVRILSKADDGKRDLCELQLFNDGGVPWKQGIPKEAPPAAAGMKLAFSDDFDGPLSISKDGIGARYSAHKYKGGDFSGWQFSDPLGDARPFSQVGTWLKISATNPTGEKGKGISGLIESIAADGSGFLAKPPFYMECRFIAQSAPGTWPAFWTLTKSEDKKPCDELDIVEAYGGYGPKNPNYPGYSCTSHFWAQTNADGSKKHGVSQRVVMRDIGSKADWSATPHTYGLLVNEKDTVYFLDDIEVLRHPTNAVSLNPQFFLINYAIGGISGWKIDLARYGNASDMYVDYVRVYQK